MNEPDNYRKVIKGEKKEKERTKQEDKPPGDQGIKNIRVRDKVTLREKNWGTKTVREHQNQKPCHATEKCLAVYHSFPLL